MISANSGRRDALRLLASGAISAALPATAQTAAPPNLLFILVDDMGWGDAGFNGRKDYHTPNLDRLATQGTVFNRWYSAAPLCAPSRACFLTGRYTIHHGVHKNGDDLPKTEVTIAQALKPRGYSTALIGKWHRGNLPDGSFTHPLDFGFDHTFGYLDARSAWEHYPKTLFRGRQEVPVSGYSADILTDEALRWIGDQRAKPFFLYLAYIEPHLRIEAPEDDVSLYRGKFREKDPAHPYNAIYAAMIHRLDAQIGRVLKALDDRGLTNNTLVVFTSDNGATFESGNQGASWYHDSNRPFRGQKRSLEEGGVREPAIVRWPGRVPRGRTADDLIHMIDVMPSLCAAAGAAVDPAWRLDGVNLLDVWTGKSRAPDRTVFWEWNAEGYHMYSAMRGDFKLLDIGGNQFLYNVREDAGERRTVFAEYPDMFQQLKAELKAWQSTAIR